MPLKSKLPQQRSHSAVLSPEHGEAGARSLIWLIDFELERLAIRQLACRTRTKALLLDVAASKQGPGRSSIGVAMGKAEANKRKACETWRDCGHRIEGAEQQGGPDL